MIFILLSGKKANWSHGRRRRHRRRSAGRGERGRGGRERKTRAATGRASDADEAVDFDGREHRKKPLVLSLVRSHLFSRPTFHSSLPTKNVWSGGSPSRWTTWEPREKKRKVKSMVWILMLFFQLLVAPAEPPKRPLRVHRGVELCVDLSRQGALESESEQARSARRLKEVLLARLSLPKRGESSWSRKISGIRRRKKPRPRPLCFYAASRSSAKRDER